jgi:catechol 2,3-dioxygenase-like lactoylglutathione lyase family enzyme
VDEEVIPVLYIEDAARAVAWYERLGFRKEWEHQFEPGFPWFISVARGRVRLYLSEHKGDARPDTLIHLYVNDIDAVSAEFGVPVDEEGLAGRECALEDPDGNRLRVDIRAPGPYRRFRTALALGEPLDDTNQVFAPVALAPGERNELPRPHDHGTALGAARDGDTAPATEVD